MLATTLTENTLVGVQEIDIPHFRTERWQHMTAALQHSTSFRQANELPNLNRKSTVQVLQPKLNYKLKHAAKTSDI